MVIENKILIKIKTIWFICDNWKDLWLIIKLLFDCVPKSRYRHVTTYVDQTIVYLMYCMKSRATKSHEFC